jgi:hypothetical protein
MLFYLPLEINDFLQQVCSLSKFHGHLFEASSRTFWTEPFLSELSNVMGDGDPNLLWEDRAFFLHTIHGRFPSHVSRVRFLTFPHIPASGVSMR